MHTKTSYKELSDAVHLRPTWKNFPVVNPDTGKFEGVVPRKRIESILSDMREACLSASTDHEARSSNEHSRSRALFAVTRRFPPLTSSRMDAKPRCFAELADLGVRVSHCHLGIDRTTSRCLTWLC